VLLLCSRIEPRNQQQAEKILWEASFLYADSRESHYLLGGIQLKFAIELFGRNNKSFEDALQKRET
jgi:hypothetical protein